MPTDKSDVDYLNNEFDTINAAHNSLPPYTLIKVSHKGRRIVITVNDHMPRTNGTLLDLSSEAALMLGIENDESVPCKIEKVIHHNPIIKMMLYAIPILGCIIIFISLI